MRPAVLMRGGARLVLVFPDDRAPATSALDPDPSRAAELIAGGLPLGLPATVRRWIEEKANGLPLAIADPVLQGAFDAAKLATARASEADRRRARGRVPPTAPSEERPFHLALARLRSEALLSSPLETMISLAREEERVARALGREEGASDQWVAGSSLPLQEYAAESARFRAEFTDHHERLTRVLEESAGRLVPNLSALIGPRVAARLVAAAGSPATLGRWAGSRIQLLGARRRPGGDRGPRFGILYQAVRSAGLPPSRQGAYARSLAALAAIAARADAVTGADLASTLVQRRDRRISRLRAGGGR